METKAITRAEGWEVRLNSTIEKYLNERFIWGESDCLIFMADCLCAVSNVNIMADWRGDYDTEEEAYELLNLCTGGNNEVIFKGLSRVENVAFAQRGDIGIAFIDEKEFFGVVDLSGSNFLIRTELGLKKVKLRESKLKLWRAE